MKCPICNGEGQFFEDRIECDVIYTPCGYCQNTGRISLWLLLKYMYFTRDWKLKGQGGR